MNDISFTPDFMEHTVRRLAEQRSELCDGSGRAFWPVPAVFPQFLARTLHLLQDRITAFYLAGDVEAANVLAAARCQLTKIVDEGDLGENHTRLFVEDHPGIRHLEHHECVRLPFVRFCEGVLSVDDPLMLLGMVTRNEEGSLGEVRALLECNLVSDGIYAQTHLIEEDQHGELSLMIRDLLLRSVSCRDTFEAGMQLHDKLYASICT